MPHLAVHGIASRVQTALPSIQILLRNLRPGFHHIYPKQDKGTSNVTLLENTRRGSIEACRMLPRVNDSK